MLRGRCYCAVSERPGTSFAPRTQLTPLFPPRPERLLRRVHPRIPLSPLFPLHPRKLPVSALFPLLTQKQGGGVAPNKELTVPGGQLPGGKKKADPSRKMTLAAEFLCHSSSGDFNRLEDSAPSCGLSTVNCKLDFLRPAFTITLIAIVGAPTFLRLAWPLSFLRIFLNSKLTTDHLKLSNSNHSRTYARVARKSNYSRTYVRQGGGGR